MDSLYMHSRYTQRIPAQQYSTHRMANVTRSGSSIHNCSRKSGGSSGHTNQYPSDRLQGSGSCNDHQISGTSCCGTYSNETGRQLQQSGGNNGSNESSEGQQMSDWDYDDNNPRSPCQRTPILNNCSHTAN
jgi:hypothetical protein